MNLIRVLKKYECPYCKSLYDNENEVENCLNGHNVVFAVFKDKGTVDCWGRGDTNWVQTDLLFKNYKDVKKYLGLDDYKVVIRELITSSIK